MLALICKNNFFHGAQPHAEVWMSTVVQYRRRKAEKYRHYTDSSKIVKEERNKELARSLLL